MFYYFYYLILHMMWHTFHLDYDSTLLNSYLWFQSIYLIYQYML